MDEYEVIITPDAENVHRHFILVDYAKLFSVLAAV